MRISFTALLQIQQLSRYEHSVPQRAPQLSRHLPERGCLSCFAQVRRPVWIRASHLLSYIISVAGRDTFGKDASLKNFTLHCMTLRDTQGLRSGLSCQLQARTGNRQGTTPARLNHALGRVPLSPRSLLAPRSFPISRALNHVCSVLCTDVSCTSYIWLCLTCVPLKGTLIAHRRYLPKEVLAP